MVEVFFDPQTTATLLRREVTSLVSDSGITRARMITATWLMYQKASEAYWYFPDGVYVEQFDTLLNVVASLKADTAYYYERRKMWVANGNVDMTNLAGERFQTSQVFWDQQNKTVYSDSFIHISKGDMITTGIGFRSDEDLSVWEIFNSTAEIPVESQRHTLDTDSITPPDSTVHSDL